MRRETKNKIVEFDSKYLNGILAKIYNSNENRISAFIEYKDSFLKMKKAVVLREPVADMMLMQIENANNHYHRYQAYDYAVRYLAVENYFGKNDFGFELYKKMHTKGGNYGDINEKAEYYEKMRKRGRIPSLRPLRKEQHSIEQFKTLIESVEKNGFDDNSAVRADKNLLSSDGSHRNVLAFYFEKEYINVEVWNTLWKRLYSIDWFWKKGFTQEEIRIISAKMDDLLETCRERIGDFYCVLYPPAEKYFSEITDDIAKIEPNNIEVVKYEDYEWKERELISLLNGLYYFDCINPKQFERKMRCILNASDIVGGKLRFRVVQIKIHNPMYRVKNKNGMPESIATVRLKACIRERYRSKDKKFTQCFVDNYEHDVIIHSTDNYISNKAFRVIFCLDRSLGEFKQIIERYDCTVKINEEEVNGIPDCFCIGDCIRVLCKRNNKFLIDDMKRWVLNKFADKSIRVKVSDNNTTVSYESYVLLDVVIECKQQKDFFDC